MLVEEKQQLGAYHSIFRFIYRLSSPEGFLEWFTISSNHVFVSNVVTDLKEKIYNEILNKKT